MPKGELANRYDIVIAGGGMVGASLALQLNHASNGRFKILVVEPFPFSQTDYQPSFDARSSALSYGSKIIFEKLGVWRSLEKHLTDISSIHVSEKGRFGSTFIDTDAMGLPQLGYVIDNAWLGQVLLQAVDACEAIHWHCPASVESVKCQRESVQLTIKQGDTDSSIETPLVVVADGARSSLRQSLAIETRHEDYQQTAIISNVSFSKPHNGCAYERFTDWGPMALLPLSDDSQGQARAALVWTMPEERAESLCDVDDAEFLKQLQQRFGNRQGQFVRVGERHRYPLSLIEAQEQVRTGVVIMGNAAHSLHPVAGQGFNLALRDCARLSEVLAEAQEQGDSLGSLSVLNRYINQQHSDQFKTITFSDQLTKLFTRYQGGLSHVRNLGLSALDVLPAAKQQFVEHAAGINDGATVGALR